jgi:two-component system LytT family response regulator
MKIRTLLVEDEVHAVERLRQLCASDPGIVVVGEAASGPEAIEKIQLLAPKLVLLDADLGAMTGLDVLAAIDPEDMPFVVFMTAYDRYAASAFERDAIDYLLKPCTPERFGRAMSKLRSRIERGAQPPRLDLSGSGPAPRRDGLFLEDNSRYVFVDFATIDFIEAARNYVVIHVGSKSYCHRAAISALEQALDPGRFARIHKSIIVNLDRVESIEPDFGGVYQLRLMGGGGCRSGQSYRSRIHDLLKASPLRAPAGN